MNIKVSTHPIQEIGVTGIIIQFILKSFTPFICRFVSNPNVITVLNIFIAFLIFYQLVDGGLIFAGLLIYLALFLDLLDGSVARFHNKSSIKGKILDSLADVLLWILIILGIFINTGFLLVFIVLSLYSLDVYIRNIILDVNEKTIAKTLNNSQEVSKHSFIKIFFNHFDSLSILALFLIFNSELLLIWIIYEFVRRLLNLTKRFIDLVEIM